MDLFQPPTEDDVVARKKERVRSCKHIFHHYYAHTKNDPCDNNLEIGRHALICQECMLRRELEFTRDKRSGKVIRTRESYLDHKSNILLETRVQGNLQYGLIRPT